MDTPALKSTNPTVTPGQPKILTNPFIPPPPPPPKRVSSQTLLLIITTLIVGVSVPATVLLVRQQNDIRGRAAEPKDTQPLLPSLSPKPILSVCGGICTVHADCAPGFFCTNGFCKNALCPTAIDCVCQEK